MRSSMPLKLLTTPASSSSCLAALITLSMLCANSATAKDYSPFKLNVARTSTEAATVGDSALGNELTRDVWNIKLAAAMPINKEWMIGANLGFDNLDYGWKVGQDSAIRNSSVPWSSINQYSAGLSLLYRPNKQWTFLFAPKLQYAYANTASSSNAQSYGVVASGMYKFDSGNMLGVGVAYLNDISEVRAVPYVAVRWNITDKLVLANPLEAGFSGPAGLELSYLHSDDWQFGIGTSRRTERFLIENDSTTVEIEEWVGFVRAGWDVSQSVQVNLYAGYFFAGDIELSEPEVTQDMSSQVAGGLAFSVKF